MPHFISPSVYDKFIKITENNSRTEVSDNNVRVYVQA